MTTAVAKSREDLIVNTLRDSTLSLPLYLTKAFEFPEVSEIEVWKLAPGSWDGALKDHLRPGFDPSMIESFLLDKHKPGRFVLKPILDGKQRAPRMVSLGDFEEPPPRAASNGHHESDLDPSQVLRNFAEELKEDLGLGRLTELKDSQEQKRLLRDLMPMQIMAEIAKSMRPQATGGNDRVLDLVISTLKDQRDTAERREQLMMEELRSIRQQAAAVTTKPVDTLQQLRDNIELATKLGIVGKTVSAGLWTPEAVSTILTNGVTPVLNSPLFAALGDAVRARMGASPAPAGALPERKT